MASKFISSIYLQVITRNKISKGLVIRKDFRKTITQDKRKSEILIRILVEERDLIKYRVRSCKNVMRKNWLRCLRRHRNMISRICQKMSS
jgi:hypothetical protein